MAPGRSGLVKLNGMSRSNFIVFVFLSLSQYQFVLKEIGGKTSYKFSYFKPVTVTQQELIIPIWRKLLNYLDCAQHEEKFNVNQPVIFWLLPRLGRVNFRPLTSSSPPQNHIDPLKSASIVNGWYVWEGWRKVTSFVNWKYFKALSVTSQVQGRVTRSNLGLFLMI